VSEAARAPFDRIVRFARSLFAPLGRNPIIRGAIRPGARVRNPEASMATGFAVW
jgi:hypothetical protein